MQSLHSLLITTSHQHLDDAASTTGVWLEDFAAAYYILKDGGEYVTVATPAGGQIPVDPNSQYPASATENTQRFLADPQALYHFSHALPLNEVKAAQFDLLFLAGGYGAMWDFPYNKKIQLLINESLHTDKPVGLVGHAAAALILLTTFNKEPFVKGMRLTAFSNSEERAAHLGEKPPFLLETALISLGALYTKGADFDSYTVTDRNIITGQNPASSAEVARQILSTAHTRKQAQKLENV